MYLCGICDQINTVLLHSHRTTNVLPLLLRWSGMKKYQINVVREERRIKTIEVEAESVETAKSLAVTVAMDCSRESFDMDTVDWFPVRIAEQ